MPPKPLRKWRPRLPIIVVAVLLTVAALPVAALLLVYPEFGIRTLDIGAFLPAIIAIIVVTALVGYVFVRALMVPVQELTDRTERLRGGDRSALRPLTRHGSRELADLSVGVFGMADALFERTDYISNFATHVSHEVKTPLTSIRGAVELILDQDEGMPESDRRRFLENILDDTWRITALLDRLRQLARADNPQERGETTVIAVLTSLAQRYPEMDISSSGAVDLPIAITPENVSIVFSNLIDNAVQHEARRVSVQASVEGGMLAVNLIDDGVGVSNANAGRIFDLFFTTCRDSGGTGMGLGIVRSMLEAHGGSIRLCPSRPNACLPGAMFQIHAPLT